MGARRGAPRYGPSREPSPRCFRRVWCAPRLDRVGGTCKEAYRYGERGTSSHVRPGITVGERRWCPLPGLLCAFKK